MELHQLRYLVAVVDEGSFTAAAERLHVSQSGVSAQVAKLERELGQRLLDRGARSLRLTGTGEAVLPLARRALDTIDQIARTADDLVGLIRGRVSLGMVRGCTIPPFLDAVSSFRLDHPQVELTLVEDDSVDLQRRVHAGELDLALVAWAGALESGLDAEVVVDEPVALVVSEGHPRATGRAPDWADLDGETLLSLSRGTGVRAAVDALLQTAGRPITIGLEASSPETILGLVRRGVGVALLTGSMAAVEGVVVRSFAPSTRGVASVRLGVVRRVDGSNPAGRMLYNAMTTALTGQPAAVPGSGAQHRP